MFLPTKGVSSERALLTVGSEILNSLHGDMSVSALWEVFVRSRRALPVKSRVTFDWFALALSSLYALGLIEMSDDGYIRRSSVS
ncbi:ABC-three component system middle component 6 [Leifsonia xyli]|uniref:ABC-three component system middle component 6 n=1 Tax=Leifsonia xyli TaxID=1575 RepID=UPI003D677144